MEREVPTATLLREKQAARFLAIEVSTLRRWRWAGTGPQFIKIGAAVRYDPADLRAFIRAGRRSSTTETEVEARHR
jgi:predicted DNA-binding transcriptional regulator AlpA